MRMALPVSLTVSNRRRNNKTYGIFHTHIRNSENEQ